MKIAEVRKAVEQIASSSLADRGFLSKSGFGEYTLDTSTGEKLGILLDVLRYDNSYNINFHIYVSYPVVQELFGHLNPKFPYSITLIAGSYSFDSSVVGTEPFENEVQNGLQNSINKIKTIDTFSKLYSNLAKPDYKDWVTGDKVVQFRIKLAKVVSEKDVSGFKALQAEIHEVCKKQYSQQYREQLMETLNSVVIT